MATPTNLANRAKEKGAGRGRAAIARPVYAAPPRSPPTPDGRVAAAARIRSRVAPAAARPTAHPPKRRIGVRTHRPHQAVRGIQTIPGSWPQLPTDLRGRQVGLTAPAPSTTTDPGPARPHALKADQAVEKLVERERFVPRKGEPVDPEAAAESFANPRRVRVRRNRRRQDRDRSTRSTPARGSWPATPPTARRAETPSAASTAGSRRSTEFEL